MSVPSVAWAQASTLAEPQVGPVQPPEPSAVRRGHDAYQRYCQSCHGIYGYGRGESADYLEVKPRDFTVGVYKFRSTPSGTLPTDADLARSIRNGMWGTGMPSWRGLSDGEVADLVAYLESFSDKFYKEGRGVPITIPPEPPTSPQSVAAGKELYEENGCATCHGKEGRGSASAPDLKDAWGNPIRPLDFTNGHWKSGPTRADLYKDFMTGLNGTPMPSYAEVLRPEQAWDLVHYLVSLVTKRGWRAGDSPGDQGRFDLQAP
jgi:cytochrome c oxidase cbb3-type subunit 2